MAKRAKKAVAEAGMPAWLVTFSDLMTLLLTFFVLLVSMAVLDEQKKLIVLGSITGAFGMRPQGVNPLSTQDHRMTQDQGPMEDVQDLATLQSILWEDARLDMRFAENKLMQIISITTDVLFEPGSARISSRGRLILSRIAPEIARLDWPVLLAGHTTTLRDELGQDFLDHKQVEGELTPEWKLSLHRALAVYTALVDAGVPASRLKIESFAANRPRFDNTNALGRRMNRRVDIVLDKRAQDKTHRIQNLMPEEQSESIIDLDGFRFRVDEFGSDAQGRP
jgi:chemotaxis protein MotB